MYTKLDVKECDKQNLHKNLRNTLLKVSVYRKIFLHILW